LKIILIRDYEKLGYAGDIINVKDGYAKNYLIPNNIAQTATTGNIKQMEIVKKSLIKKEAKNIEEASKIGEIIDGMQIKFVVNTSPEGKLYGSITNKDIAEKILEEKNVEIDRKKIELDEHLKELGVYDIGVKLYKDVKAVIKVEVVSEGFVEGAPEGVVVEDAEESVGLEGAPESAGVEVAEKDNGIEYDSKVISEESAYEVDGVEISEAKDEQKVSEGKPDNDEKMISGEENNENIEENKTEPEPDNKKQ